MHLISISLLFPPWILCHLFLDWPLFSEVFKGPQSVLKGKTELCMQIHTSDGHLVKLCCGLMEPSRHVFSLLRPFIWIRNMKNWQWTSVCIEYNCIYLSFPNSAHLNKTFYSVWAFRENWNGTYLKKKKKKAELYLYLLFCNNYTLPLWQCLP